MRNVLNMGSGKIASLAYSSDNHSKMPSNQDTLLRHWHTLRLVPRYPSKITVRDIKNSLFQEGFDVTTRTLQRDLQDLSAIFPLVVDDQEKPFGWSWQKDARSFDLPGLSVSEALTLALVEQHLTQIMPASATEQLTPHFKAAHHRLDGEPLPQHSRAWLDKVRTVIPTQPLIAPEIDQEVQQQLSHALLHEKQALIRYRKKGYSETVEYRIHPLGMVQRGPILYLYCRLFDYEDTRILAIHRIHEVSVLREASIYPNDFNMDEEIRKGTWGFGTGNEIVVQLKFSAAAGEHLTESPLSGDQTIETLEDGSLRITASVPETPQLAWWLLGFGHQVTVESPSLLRDQIKNNLAQAANNYLTE